MKEENDQKAVDFCISVLNQAEKLRIPKVDLAAIGSQILLEACISGNISPETFDTCIDGIKSVFTEKRKKYRRNNESR